MIRMNLSIIFARYEVYFFQIIKSLKIILNISEDVIKLRFSLTIKSSGNCLNIALVLLAAYANCNFLKSKELECIQFDFIDASISIDGSTWNVIKKSSMFI